MPPYRWSKPKTPDAATLLANANSASQHLAVLHIAFMAMCAYVLIIVFGTTDLDLLIGKGVRLPVVNVDIPIVGFYAFAPYFVVLVHLNLLLQLQLLSRKLFAFDAAGGGLHDQLHIFPYTYYLVGRPRPVVRALVGLVVSITLVVLPLATLFALQLEFLAYQSEAVTWWQRLAIWLDVALLAALWPVILHRNDDWRSYWRALIAAYVPRRRVWIAFLLLFLGQAMLLFGTSWATVLIGLGLLMLAPLSLILLYDHKTRSRSRIIRLVLPAIFAVSAVAGGIWFDSAVLFMMGPAIFIPLAAFWHPPAPRGSLALLFALYVGLLVPLSLLVIGETVEHAVLGRLFPGSNPAAQLREFVEKLHELDKRNTTTVAVLQKVLGRLEEPSPETTLILGIFLNEKRRLDLGEQVLLSKPPTPEVLALIRAGKWQEVLTQIEPIDLQGRSLRRAVLSHVILVRADLRGTQLQGADLWGAKLQGASLGSAQLQGTSLWGAELEGAYLGGAKLQGAYLWDAELQGADLGDAQLQGASLWGAELQGANLGGAQLQGANLGDAELQGADLGDAQLQGAYLGDAKLQGAYLRGTKLQGANLGGTKLQGANMENTQLQGANLGGAQLQGADLRGAQLYGNSVDMRNAALVDAHATTWEPLSNETLITLTAELRSVIHDPKWLEDVVTRLKAASRPGAPKPQLGSCLVTENTPFTCQRRFDPTHVRQAKEFTEQLHTYLSSLACESPAIARGIIHQIPEDKDEYSTRVGLQTQLKKYLDNPTCPGLYGLQAEEKNRLRALP